MQIEEMNRHGIGRPARFSPNNPKRSWFLS